MCMTGGRLIEPGRTIGFAFQTSEIDNARGVRTLPTRRHIFFEGDKRDGVMIVEGGWVKLYRTLIDGQRQVVGFAMTGAVLGLENDDVFECSAETLTPCRIRKVSSTHLAELCRDEPEFAMRLLRQVGRQLGAAHAHLASVGAQTADQKIAAFLLSLVEGDPQSPVEIDLPMRRGDIAEFLGLRLETVSRKFSEFQRRGWIKLASLYRCRLERLDILAELAEGGEPEENLARRPA